MSDRTYNVLFLCTGNSARSILAEAILTQEGGGKFKAFSAGSHPKGEVHRYAVDLLKKLNFNADNFRSKGWDEFAAENAPEMDFVFTVCDSAANEICPIWPGQPMTAHWGVPDPAAGFQRCCAVGKPGQAMGPPYSSSLLHMPTSFSGSSTPRPLPPALDRH